MRGNPIVRGDLRARLSGPTAIAGYTLFLSVLAILTILSLPPELGRIQDVRQQDLLEVFLIIQALFIIYLTSATASGEIAVEGEKASWDLAASPFPGGVIARGKVATSALFSALLVGLALPLTAVVAGIRGHSLVPALAAGGVTIAAATALGILGAFYSAVFESDFTRSAVHWMTLGLVIVGTAMAPEPWRVISPVYAIPAAIGGDGAGLLVALAVYAGLIAASTVALGARIGAIRREAQAA